MLWESGQPARSVALEKEEQELLRDLFLLTDKPIIYVANIAESDLGEDVDNLPSGQAAPEYVEPQGAEVMAVSRQGGGRTLRAGKRGKGHVYGGIGNRGIRPFQAGEKILFPFGPHQLSHGGKAEVRAWTITRAPRPPQAAGKIHSDFERGFIEAEVIAFDALKELGGDMQAAKEKGLIRQEGKEYVMQDGDIVLFKFNV